MTKSHTVDNLVDADLPHRTAPHVPFVLRGHLFNVVAHLRRVVLDPVLDVRWVGYFIYQCRGCGHLVPEGGLLPVSTCAGELELGHRHTIQGER